jgi:hypothetical protein
MNPPVPFQDALVSLLAERKLLRQLSRNLTVCLLLADRQKAAQTEQRISDLVQGPLHLSKRESNSEHFLAEAVQNLFSTLNDFRYYDEPSRVWEHSPIPGVGLSWPRALQERLTALCGPLDVTVSEMFEAAQVSLPC